MLRSASETLGFLKPELPTLVPEPPAGEGWVRGGPSRNWLKIKNMVESEFVLLGTEVDDSGIPRAILARSRMDSWSSRAGDFASPATAEWAGQAIVNVDRCQAGDGRTAAAAGTVDRPATGDARQRARMEAHMTERASMWELSKRVVRLRLVRLALWAARRLMDYVEKVKREAAPLDREGG